MGPVRDFEHQLSVLCCPRCGAGLGLRELPQEDGSVVCPACSEAYPVRKGVLGLFYVDDTWFWPLHELLASWDLARKALEGKLEPDRIESHNPHAFGTMSAIEEMTSAMMTRIGEPQGRLVLEPGCGSCGHAKLLADAGFSVIALDVKPAELLAPRPRDVMVPSESFFASYYGTSDVFPPDQIRFLRVVGDLFNLPLADGSVDLVFSRGVLHHVNPLVPAMVEVGRVLKPEGTWAAASEPASGMLQWDTQPVLDYMIESQEGLHEQCPSFANYLKGFTRGGLDLERWDVWHAQPRIEIGLKGYRRWRLSWAGPELADRGRRHFPLWQLRWMKTGSNFLARRTTDAPPPRQLDPARERYADALWLFEPERYHGQLRAALRKMVPTRLLRSPARLGRLPYPDVQLRGFRQVERVEGRLVRYSTQTASVYLPHPATPPRRLWIEYVVPGSQASSPMTAQVRVNDRLLGIAGSEQAGPQRVEFPIPPEIAEAPGTVEVVLELDRWWREPSTGRLLGLAVERIGVA